MKIKTSIISLFLLWVGSLSIWGQAVLLDKTTSLPISYAQITNQDGVTVGTTDIDGKLPLNIKDKIVIIQHLAYNPETVKTSLFNQNSPIFLSPIDYELEEVNVTSKNVDYIYLKTYFRSYQLNDSCMKYFKDGFLDFFISLKNKKNKKYASRIRLFQNNELISNDKQKAASVVDKYIYTPYLEDLTLIERLKKEGWRFRSDTIDSRLYLNGTIGGAVRLDTIRELLRIEYDALATKEKKTKTLFGYTTRLENYYQTENYKYNPDYQSYIDLINKKDYRKLFYKHKSDSKEQLVEVFDELYVLEHKYITRNEIKQYKNKYKLKINESNIDNTFIEPLNPQLEYILKTEMEEVK